MRALFFLCVIQGFAAYHLTWGTPAANLDSNPPAGDTDENVSIAMDPLGNAVATWGRTSGASATADIWASQYNHNQRVWSATVRISGGGNALSSRVAIDSAGNSIFVWEEGFPTKIFSRTLTKEGVWTPPLEHPAIAIFDSPYEQTSPYVVKDKEGNSLAIWIQFEKGVSHIHSAKKWGNSNWIDLGLLSSPKVRSTLAGTKALTTNSQGQALAVWEEAGAEIHAAFYTNGVWLPQVTVTKEQSESPSAGLDVQGNALVVWESQGVIRSRSITRGLLASETKSVSNPTFVAKHPDIGVDDKGNALVVYERYNSLHKFISSASFSAQTQSWSTPVDISAPSSMASHIAGYPILSSNTIGDAVAIWKEHVGDHIVIQGAGYSLGTWSLHRLLSSIDNHAGAFVPSYDIAVSINATGNIMAVWPEDCSQMRSLQVKASPGIGKLQNEDLPILVAIEPPVETPHFQLKTNIGIGLASLGSAPPVINPVTIENGIVYGKQVLHRFPAHSDLINILSWDAPPGVAYYKIYRTNLSNQIGVSQKPYYEDHQRAPKKKELYLITSVGFNEQESAPITIVVHPR